MTIESVKVYANGAGTREIALVDANGTVLESTTVDLPEGESTVDLGFYVVAGEGFGLRSLDDNPQLWRDGIGSEQTYPYALGDFGEITGTSVNGANGQNYYYFYYDWTVSVDAVGCASARTPLTVTVTNPVAVGEIAGLNAVEAYPNPTAGALALDLDLGANVLDLQVDVLDLQGRAVQSATWSGQVTGRRNPRPRQPGPPATTPCASPTARAMAPPRPPQLSAANTGVHDPSLIESGPTRGRFCVAQASARWGDGQWWLFKFDLQSGPRAELRWPASLG